jgi:hypothetical protein
VIDNEDNAYPCCERCWIADNSRWEPDSVSEDGKIITKLTAVAVPTFLQLGNVNVCATCGEITVVGIYRELDEDEVQYDVEPLAVADGDEPPPYVI